ncbi:MAG: QueT transporter family protein [Clostridiales bacterium]|nr:QueT transporter family protein [Clostridiales bacterium]
MFRKKDTRFITRAAVIAAIYCALTLLLRPISYGEVQLRVSEALTILPVLTPAAVPGLFIGCLLANLLGGSTVIDIVFGSLATLGAALVTRKLRNKPALAALAPVLFNAVIIGLVLSGLSDMPLPLIMLWIGLGEAAACYALGLPLLYMLKRAKLDTKLFAD